MGTQVPGGNRLIVGEYMRTCLLVAGAAISLTACGTSTPGASPTPAATGAGAAAAVPAARTTRLMGEWEYTTAMKITSVKGLPPEVSSKMEGASPPPQVRRECLSKPETRADVDKMFESTSGGCKFTKTEAPADKIVGTVVCNNPQGMNGTGSINGSIGPSDLSLSMALNSIVPSPVDHSTKANLQMLITMTGKRIGDCPK